MAREAGAVTGSPAPNAPEIIFTQCLDIERFAALVRADEREETNRRANASWTLMCEKMVAAERETCAKVCEEHQFASIGLAAAIRARGTHDPM
jgi:hypothetical protein